MIIINILIFFLFGALFIVSAKYRQSVAKGSAFKEIFYGGAEYLISHLPNDTSELRQKQRMLKPSEKPEKAAGNFLRKVSAEILMLIFIGNVLSFLAGLQGAGAGRALSSVSRNGYGEMSRKVTLEVKTSDRRLKEPIDIEVSPRKYTGKEIQAIFDEIKRALPVEMLAENKSSSHVDCDLNFIKKYKEYPVEIEWYPDNFECINSEGKLDDEFSEEAGERVNIRAGLTYEEFYDEVNIPITVFPRKRYGEEKLRFEIRKALENADKVSETESGISLPKRIDSGEISFFSPVSKTGITILLLSLLGALGIFYGRNDEIKKEIVNRERQMKADYPKIVSRLALLLGAGMTIRGAFEKTARDYEMSRAKGQSPMHYAYEEMLITVRLMNSGTGEMTAYQEFGMRSGVSEYRKLGTLLSQNLKKGSAGILSLLEYEAANAFENRKSEARRLGEEAGTKLLLPMGIMLLIVLLIILIPSIMSFGF